MKKILILVLAFILLLPGLSLAVEVPVTNPGFEEADDMGNPVGWRLTMYVSDEMVSEGGIVSEALEGGYSVHILNEEANDARFEQRIDVEKDTLYRFSCMAKASGCGDEGTGANLSVLESFEGSPELKDTAGMWRELEFYGRTAPDQTRVTLAVRIGGYGAMNRGEAWFDSVKVEKVDAAPAGVTIADLNSVAGASSNREAEQSGGGEWTGALGTRQTLILAVLFTIILFMADRWFRSRSSLGFKNVNTVMLAIIIFAVVARLIMAYFTPGHEVDISCFRAWAASMAEVGPGNFYAMQSFCDYPPGYMYVLWIVGSLFNLLSLDDAGITLVVKLFPCIVDGLLAYVVYRIAKEKLNTKIAFGLGLFIALNPAYFYNSAVWGQIDSVLTIMLALSLIFVVKKKWAFALPIYTLAVLIKPQALMVGPIGLMALIMDFVKTDKKYREKLLTGTAIGICASLAAIIITVAPFTNDWLWIFRQYTTTLGSYPNAVLNTYNLYALADKNWAPLADPFLFGVSFRVWGIVAIAAAVIYGLYLVWRSKDNSTIWLICSVTLMIIFTFGTQMHERYSMPIIALLIVAYIMNRDIRIKYAAGALTMTTFINIALVLRFMHLQNSHLPITMFFSAVNIAICLTLIWAAWDICVRGVTITAKERQLKDSPVSGVALGTPLFLQNLLDGKDYRLNMKWVDYVLIGVLTLSYGVLAFVNLGDMKAPENGFKSTERYESVTFDLGDIKDVRRFYYYGGICKGQMRVLLSKDGTNWLDAGVAYYPTNTMFRWQIFDVATGAGPKFDSDEEIPEFYADGYSVLDNVVSVDGVSGGSLIVVPEVTELEEDADDGFIDDGFIIDESADTGEYIEEEPIVFDTNARYVRVVFRTRALEFFEFGFGDIDGTVYPIIGVTDEGARMGSSQNPENLVDEQDCVVEPSYMNGTYFDEIYHARTAYEHIHGIEPYETTHPPLGKVFISFGIMLFGMTPFGWRFSGALCGVLMVPAIYLLAKQLLKRTDLSFLAALLFTFDCMHFAQTRVSTIDSYPVLFIMLTYLFMFRYAQMSFYREKLYKTLIPLGLCGICMGIGIATKWIAIYSTAGLAVILFCVWISRYLESKHSRSLKARDDEHFKRAAKNFWSNVGISAAFCVVFFILIPGVIYYLSYIPHLTPSGNMNLEGVMDAQYSMFNYHKGVTDPHGFQSSWWEWPLMLRPMWYYSGSYLPHGMVSEISTLGNPFVWWGGFAALLWVGYRLVTKKSFRDMRMWLVIAAFAAQYLPWVLIPRSTFIYHYFASVPFIILCISLFVEEFEKKHKHAIKYAFAYAGACVVIFFCFYPVISGLPVMRDNVQWLNWLPRWYLMNGAHTWPVWRAIGGWLGI